MSSLRIEIHGQVVVARLADAPVRVGRDPSCDLRIDDPAVSAAHAAIEPHGAGGHRLIDLRSGMPTRVNGAVVQRVLLKGGDVIQVGPARITYLVEAQTAGGEGPRAAVAPAARSQKAAVSVPARASSTGVAVAVARPVVARVVPSIAPAVSASAGPSAADPLAPAREEAAASLPAPEPASPAPEAVPAKATAAAVRAESGREASAKRLRYALWAAGAFAAVALGLAAILRNAGDSTLDLRALRLDLDRAKAMAGEDVDGALVLLEKLSASPVVGVRREAESEIAYLKKRREQAEGDVADLLARAPKLDEARWGAELAGLEEKYGAPLARRHAELVAKGAAARRAFLEGRSTDVGGLAVALAEEGRFAEALAAWDELALAVPGEEETRRLVEDGRQAVEAKAGAAWAELAGRAADVANAEGPRAAARLLRERLPAFAGTASAGALALRAAGYDRAVTSTPGSAPATGPTSAAAPSPAPSPTSSAPTPTPAPAPAPPVPTVPSAHARLESLLADADAKAGTRKFGPALGVLDEAKNLALGTADAGRVAARHADLVLAQEGLASLARTIREHPDRFVGIEIAPKYAASLVDADDEFVTAAVPGGRTKVRWASFDAAKTVLLVEAARLAPKDSLSLAALLHEVGATEAAERTLFQVATGGGDKPAADARLARWRGETVPSGGYVVHAGRLVSPVDRERLVLEGRVASACAKVGAKDAKERKAAYDELFALGAPAKEAFAKALHARREAATHEIASLKVFTSGRTRARLLQELEKRRAAALALIEDEVAYPYPYPPSGDHPGQKDVDRLVDLVREVYERPFDLVSTWDKTAGESLALVREVDELLVQVEEGYVADLDAVKAAINKAVDVPGQVSQPYDKEVLAYNEKVGTTATGQEKENVRIVNAYRIMMGRSAVKLDERLVRAARGHSLEMAKLDYFAHESPTPGLESPGKRCARQGYSGGTGENIAKGTSTAQAAFDGWYHSSGHHRNMLGRHWTEMGTGRAHGILWTQNFGALTGKSLTDPGPFAPPAADVAPEKEDAEGNPAAPGDGPPAVGDGSGDGTGDGAGPGTPGPGDGKR